MAQIDKAALFGQKLLFFEKFKIGLTFQDLRTRTQNNKTAKIYKRHQNKVLSGLGEKVVLKWHFIEKFLIYAHNNS